MQVPFFACNTLYAAGRIAARSFRWSLRRQIRLTVSDMNSAMTKDHHTAVTSPVIRPMMNAQGISTKSWRTREMIME